ncbi:MAG: PAS domain S-box protein [Lentisphaeria bacterium]|nr:PAS domain S-box protein [Candidatus Neomarinimicrobiota bacterium]MCF7842158.1 PAS domain S-box protein [Lentisphaeria bacterium]
MKKTSLPSISKSIPFGRILVIVSVLTLVLTTTGGSQPVGDSLFDNSVPNILRVGFPVDRAPLAYLDSENQITGLSHDVLTAAADYLKITTIDTPLVNVPAGIEALKRGEIDVVAMVGFAAERIGEMEFTTPYLQVDEVIFSRREDGDYNSLESLRGQRIATIQSTISDNFIASIPRIDQVSVHSAEEAFSQLANHQVDAVIYIREVGYYLLNVLNLMNQITFSEIPLRTIRVHMAVQVGDKALSLQLNHAITQLGTNGTLSRIYEKWFGENPFALYSRREMRIFITSAVIAAILLTLVIVGFFSWRKLRHERDRLIRVLKERDAATEALDLTERRLSLIAAQTQDALFAYDMDQNLVFANSALEKLSGLSFRELQKIQAVEWFHPDDKKRLLEIWDRAFHGEAFENVEFRMRNVHNQWFWFRGSWGPILDENGRQIGVQGIEHDITPLKKSMLALQESETRFRVALRHVPILVFSQDADLNYTWMYDPEGNGDNLEETPEDHFFSRLPEIEQQRVAALKKQVLSTGKPQQSELILTTKAEEGKAFINLVLEPTLDENGAVTGLIGAALDLSQQKRIQERLNQRLKAEQLLSAISATFVGHYDTDAAVEVALENLGDLIQVDSVAVFQRSKDNLSFSQTHVWQSETDQPPAGESLKSVDTKSNPGLADQLSRGEILVYSNTTGLKDDPLGVYDQLTPEGTKSFGIAPLLLNQKVGGFLLLASLRQEHAFPEYQKNYLQIAAEIIGNALERQRTEEKVTMMAHALRHLSECVSVTDLNDRIIFVNDTFCKLYGYHQDDVIGKHATILHSDRNPPSMNNEIFEKTREGGWHGELYNRRKDGTDVPIYLSTAVIRDESGTPVGLLGVAVDITERMQAEEARLRLEAAINQSSEAVAITDPEGIVLYVNPAFERITGYKREESMGHVLRNLQPDHADAVALAAIRQALDQHKSWTGRATMHRHDGSTYDEEATISPVVDGKDKIVNLVAIKRDITRQLQMEAQLQQSQKMESVGLLAGGIAHDFNNLLTPILGYSEMAMLGLAEDEPLHNTFDQIHSAAQRAKELTTQLLAFGRKQVIEMQVTDLNQVVNDLNTMLRRTVREDIQITYKLAPDLPRVNADPSQIEQVLLNLAGNAQDALADGGFIVIETERVHVEEPLVASGLDIEPGAYVVLSVSDNGHGMNSETLDHIFEPFYTTKERGKGTGLGLATAYGIIKQHNGRILASSEPGVGTTFKVYLPQLEESVSGKPTKKKKSEAKGGNETILVVEDEVMARELVRDILVHQGYKVLTAENAEEALTLSDATDNEIDLLVTDVIMPGMNGKVLYEKLSQSRPLIKVLFMSGYTDNMISPFGVLDEEIHFLQKPFAIHDLTTKVREALGN